MSNPTDSINDLARIIKAAARLMATMHRADNAVDPEDEIDHMQANLDHVRAEVAR